MNVLDFKLMVMVQTNQRNDYVQKLLKGAKVEGAGK